MSRRVVVGGLGGFAALLAALVGAVSLTRIAGAYLGFPPGLEWTLTGAVDIAGIAGGIMWTAFDGQVRKIGRPMNIVCTLVSGVGVGLDHATHANVSEGPVWPWVAFGAGLFIPALAAWILHSLSVIADVGVTPVVVGGREVTTVSGSAGRTVSATVSRPSADRQQDHQLNRQRTVSPTVSGSEVSIGPDRQDTVTFTTTQTVSDRQPELTGTTERRALPSATPRPDRVAAPPARTRALTSVPSESDREQWKPWMTDDLLTAVVTSMLGAQAKGETYGRPALMEDAGLNNYKAQTLLKYISERPELLRVSA
jgi:hypothetical protein